MFSRTSRFWITTVTLGAFLSAGCTKTRVATGSRMDAPTTQRSQPVRYSGEYVAKWTPTDKKKLKTIPGSTVVASAGEKLGFQRTADGRLMALHDGMHFPLATTPPQKGYVVWHHQSTVPTQFAKNMQIVGEGTGEVLKVTAMGALLVGLVWLDLATEDDCDDDSLFSSSDSDKHDHHKHKHHKKD